MCTFQDFDEIFDEIIVQLHNLTKKRYIVSSRRAKEHLKSISKQLQELADQFTPSSFQEIEPERCIDLIQNYINFGQPESQRRSSLQRDKLVQILIGAYSKPISHEYKEKVMNIFDKILQDQAYKREGLKVLEEQDRG